MLELPERLIDQSAPFRHLANHLKHPVDQMGEHGIGTDILAELLEQKRSNNQSPPLVGIDRAERRERASAIQGTLFRPRPRPGLRGTGLCAALTSTLQLLAQQRQDLIGISNTGHRGSLVHRVTDRELAEQQRRS